MQFYHVAVKQHDPMPPPPGAALTPPAWCTGELPDSRCHRQRHSLAASVPGGTKQTQTIQNGKFCLDAAGAPKRCAAAPSPSPRTLPHLWRHKVGGVTGGEEQAVAPPELLGEAKVTDPDGVGVPRVVHVQDVAGFQVSVYHLGGRKGGRKLAEMEAGRKRLASAPDQCSLRTPWQWR